MEVINNEEVQNVLLADDDKDDFELFSEAIYELGLKIVLTRAENGEILMRLIRKSTPDLLFLDLILPCKDGKECLQEIRSDKKFDNMPIVVYSSLTDLSTVEFCYRHAGNLYVIKPHSYESLLSILQKIFAINWKSIKYYPRRSDFVLNPEQTY